MHGKETEVWGDAAHAGKKQMIREAAPNAKDFTQRAASRNRQRTDKEQSTNRYKSKTRLRVEPAFGIMTLRFGFTKVRYKGLNKNAHHFFVSCALINLLMAKKHLLKQELLLKLQ